MSTDIKKRLAEIAAAMERGEPRKKFEKELDKLLGTEMPERDEDAEEKWESEYRNGRATD
jgi:hypothetical protein